MVSQQKRRTCFGTAKVTMTWILPEMSRTYVQGLFSVTQHKNWNFFFWSEVCDEAMMLFAFQTLSLTPPWYFENISVKKSSAYTQLWAWKFFCKIQPQRGIYFDWWGAVVRHQFTFFCSMVEFMRLLLSNFFREGI